MGLSKQDFNKEMGSYLTKKKSEESRFKDLYDFAQSREEKGEQSKDVVIVHEESGLRFHLNKTLAKLKNRNNPKKDRSEDFEDIKDIEDEELKEVDEAPESFVESTINKIKTFFSKEPEEEYIEEDTKPIPSIDDLRTIALFTQKLITRFSKKDLNELKKSEDFIKYKNILRRHELIKNE